MLDKMMSDEKKLDFVIKGSKSEILKTLKKFGSISNGLLHYKGFTPLNFKDSVIRSVIMLLPGDNFDKDFEMFFEKASVEVEKWLLEITIPKRDEKGNIVEYLKTYSHEEVKKELEL